MNFYRNGRDKLVLRVKATCSPLNEVEDLMILFIEIRHDSFTTFSLQFIIYWHDFLCKFQVSKDLLVLALAKQSAGWCQLALLAVFHVALWLVFTVVLNRLKKSLENWILLSEAGITIACVFKELHKKSFFPKINCRKVTKSAFILWNRNTDQALQNCRQPSWLVIVHVHLESFILGRDGGEPVSFPHCFNWKKFPLITKDLLPNSTPSILVASRHSFVLVPTLSCLTSSSSSLVLTPLMYFLPSWYS